jgi:Multiubiquitin
MSNPSNAVNDPVHPHGYAVTVLVNEKPVAVSGPKVTGLQIKEAAVAAQLPVDLEFVLSEEDKHGDTTLIGNGDEVHVNKHSRFLLVPPDDNS